MNICLPERPRVSLTPVPNPQIVCSALCKDGSLCDHSFPIEDLTHPDDPWPRCRKHRQEQRESWEQYTAASTEAQWIEEDLFPAIRREIMHATALEEVLKSRWVVETCIDARRREYGEREVHSIRFFGSERDAGHEERLAKVAGLIAEAEKLRRDVENQEIWLEYCKAEAQQAEQTGATQLLIEVWVPTLQRTIQIFSTGSINTLELRAILDDVMEQQHADLVPTPPTHSSVPLNPKPPVVSPLPIPSSKKIGRDRRADRRRRGQSHPPLVPVPSEDHSSMPTSATHSETGTKPPIIQNTVVKGEQTAHISQDPERKRILEARCSHKLGDPGLQAMLDGTWGQPPGHTKPYQAPSAAGWSASCLPPDPPPAVKTSWQPQQMEKAKGSLAERKSSRSKDVELEGSSRAATVGHEKLNLPTGFTKTRQTTILLPSNSPVVGSDKQAEVPQREAIPVPSGQDPMVHHSLTCKKGICGARKRISKTSYHHTLDTPHDPHVGIQADAATVQDHGPAPTRTGKGAAVLTLAASTPSAPKSRYQTAATSDDDLPLESPQLYTREATNSWDGNPGDMGLDTHNHAAHPPPPPTDASTIAQMEREIVNVRDSGSARGTSRDAAADPTRPAGVPATENSANPKVQKGEEKWSSLGGMVSWGLTVVATGMLAVSLMKGRR